MTGKAANRPAVATSNGTSGVSATVPDSASAESEPVDRDPDTSLPADPGRFDNGSTARDTTLETDVSERADETPAGEGTRAQDEAPAEEAPMDNRPASDSRLDNGAPPAAAPPDGEPPPPPASAGSGIGMFAPRSRSGSPGPAGPSGSDIGGFGEPVALDGRLAPPRIPHQAPHPGAEPGGFEPGGFETGDGRLPGAPPVDQPAPPGAVSTGKIGSPRVKVKGARKGRTLRKAHLVLSRIEPWSVMKFSFIVSLLGFIVLFVAVAGLYGVLAGLGVFDALEQTITQISAAGSGDAASDSGSWFAASRVLGYTTMIGVVNVVLITALATVGAVIYNLIADVVGGVEVTLKEAD